MTRLAPRTIAPTEMILASGRYFDFADPSRHPPDLHDIAFALARINRFTGHTPRSRGYSVAAHSLLVAALCRAKGGGARLALLGLLHDAHEAYTGDLGTPLQRALGPAALASLRDLQMHVQTAIYAALDACPPDRLEADAVAYADLQALALERSTFWPRDAEAHHWAALDGIGLASDAPCAADLRALAGMAPGEIHLAWLTAVTRTAKVAAI